MITIEKCLPFTHPGRPIVRTAVFVVAVFAFAACGTVQQDPRLGLFNGKTFEEVVAIIGPPREPDDDLIAIIGPPKENEIFWFLNYNKTEPYGRPSRITFWNSLYVACIVGVTIEHGQVVSSMYMYAGFISVPDCKHLVPRLPGQFTSKTVKQVVSVIGPPTELTDTEILWKYHETNESTVKPNQVADVETPRSSTQENESSCTIRMALWENGLVKTVTYQGQSCHRHVPTTDLFYPFHKFLHPLFSESAFANGNLAVTWMDAGEND